MTRQCVAAILATLRQAHNPMTQRVILAITTCPDEATAQAIATTLVSEKVVACVNRMVAARSTGVPASVPAGDGT